MTRRPITRLAALFPPWLDSRVLFHDDAIIVVDKPPFVSTHAEGRERADDVISRLGAFLRGDDGALPYLGTHQRLDRDTSGVLLFSRKKAANPSLAKQFEGREVRKTYVAVVEGTLHLPKGGVLRHLIVPDRDGRVRAIAPDGRGRPEKGQDAATAVTILRRVGDRALIEARPETGRTHQIRAQLAAAGAPIVGDPLYGGAPATRLMLHAAKLELRHPDDGRPLSLVAPVPPELESTLDRKTGDAPDVASVAGRMRAAADRRYGFFASGDTDAFRIVNGEGDGLPGVAVDIYGDELVVHLSDSPIAEDILLDAAASLGAEAVYVKRRPKDASRLSPTDVEQRAPKLPSRREVALPGPFVIEERAIPFEVDLGAGMSTGIFLDQRENRRRVAELAKGARVLNLFAYTGAFSVAAAKGGATTTLSVDASAPVCAWAERNLALVSADSRQHRAIAGDVFEVLKGMAKRGERFDLVILDPPSFSTTKASRFSADGGYVGLAAQAFGVVAAGGALLACTNHQGIVMAKFRRFLHEAARAAKVEVAQMKDLPAPEDFPPAPGKQAHLKSLLVRVAG